VEPPSTSFVTVWPSPKNAHVPLTNAAATTTTAKPIAFVCFDIVISLPDSGLLAYAPAETFRVIVTAGLSWPAASVALTTMT